MKNAYIDFGEALLESKKLEAISLIVKNDFSGAAEVINHLSSQHPGYLPSPHLESMSTEDLHRVLNLKIVRLEVERRVKNAILNCPRGQKELVYVGDLLCSDWPVQATRGFGRKCLSLLERSLRDLGVSLNDDPRGWSRPSES